MPSSIEVKNTSSKFDRLMPISCAATGEAASKAPFSTDLPVGNSLGRSGVRTGWSYFNDLNSERALNLELGYSGDLGPAQVPTAFFYSKVKDMIQSVPTGTLDPEGDPLTQSQNVGDGIYKGFEIAANWQLGERLGLVAHYTYLHRSVSDPIRADYRPTDTPRHNAFLRLDWQALGRLTVSPSVEVSGWRLSEAAVQPEDPAAIAYSRMGGFALANLDFDWQETQQTSVIFGVRNIFDRDYALVEGFPEPGRSFFLTTRLIF